MEPAIVIVFMWLIAIVVLGGLLGRVFRRGMNASDQRARRRAIESQLEQEILDEQYRKEAAQKLLRKAGQL